jgi:hypothetical protein
MSFYASAGDMLFRITHDDQDSLIVGEVVDIKVDTLQINVVQVISGNKTGEKIKVKTEGEVIKRLKGLQKGDKVLLSIDNNLKYYTIKWGIYKVSTTDNRTFKILEPQYMDNPALVYYINSNGKYNDFTYTDQRIFVKDGTGENVQIYPNLDEKAKLLLEESAGKIQNPYSKHNNLNKTTGIVLINVIFWMAVILLFKRKKN